ncbi:MAG: hypothetical protein C4576_17085 [Desulfobacteraceae bacterium]|nr:MAG: hypothetical protein C4576_17085 [Desulfobacteraceae bacterium]
MLDQSNMESAGPYRRSEKKSPILMQLPVGRIVLVLLTAGVLFAFFWATYPHFARAKIWGHLPSLILIWLCCEIALSLHSACNLRAGKEAGIQMEPPVAQTSRRTHLYAGAFILLFISLALNLTGLLQKWDGGSGWYYSIGGFLPWSDAAGFMTGAKSLIEFGQLDSWTARRPLGVLFYSVIMKFTGQNLLQTYLITTIFVALSFAFLSMAVMRTHGLAAGLMSLLLISDFFEPYNGLFMTEQPGLMLGSVGIGLLWLGHFFRRWKYAMLGLFIFTLALSVRAGVFLALPLICAYAGRHFRSKGVYSLKVFGTAVVAVAFSLGTSPILLKLVGPKAFTYQGNFAHTLYSLAKGGQAWNLIEKEHPELFSEGLTEDVITKRIYGYALDELKSDWGKFAKTVSGIWFDSLNHPLNFFFPVQFSFNKSTFSILLSLAFLSLLLLHRAKDRSSIAFLFVFLFGIVLSSPFLRLVNGYWQDASTARVYAASAPLNCLAFGVGLGTLVQGVRRLGTRQGDESADKPTPAASATGFFERCSFGLSVLLAAFVLVTPIYVSASHLEPKVGNVPDGCADQVPIVLRLAKSSFLEIVEDSAKDIIPRVSATAYSRNNPSLANGPIQFASLRPGMFLTVGLNLLDPSEIAYVVFQDDIRPYEGHKVQICAVQAASLKSHKMYLGQVVKVLEGED